jgi:hypothetical protein
MTPTRTNDALSKVSDRPELSDRPPQPVYSDFIEVARAFGRELGRAAEVRPGEPRSGAEHLWVLRRELQLQNSIRDRKAFQGFKEAELTHLPYVLDTHSIAPPF